MAKRCHLLVAMFHPLQIVPVFPCVHRSPLSSSDNRPSTNRGAPFPRCIVVFPCIRSTRSHCKRGSQAKTNTKEYLQNIIIILISNVQVYDKSAKFVRPAACVQRCSTVISPYTGPDERTISWSGRSQAIGTSSKLNTRQRWYREIPLAWWVLSFPSLLFSPGAL